MFDHDQQREKRPSYQLTWRELKLMGGTLVYYRPVDAWKKPTGKPQWCMCTFDNAPNGSGGVVKVYNRIRGRLWECVEMGRLDAMGEPARTLYADTRDGVYNQILWSDEDASADSLQRRQQG